MSDDYVDFDQTAFRAYVNTALVYLLDQEEFKSLNTDDDNQIDSLSKRLYKHVKDLEFPDTAVIDVTFNKLQGTYSVLVTMKNISSYKVRKEIYNFNPHMKKIIDYMAITRELSSG